jgi:hypothetical protein
MAPRTQQEICAVDEVALIAGLGWPAIIRKQSGRKGLVVDIAEKGELFEKIVVR